MSSSPFETVDCVVIGAGVVGLVLLSTLLNLLGVFACYVGVFFVMPIGFAMVSVAYRQVFPAGGAFSLRRPDFDDPEPDEPAEDPPFVTAVQAEPPRPRHDSSVKKPE